MEALARAEEVRRSWREGGKRGMYVLLCVGLEQLGLGNERRRRIITYIANSETGTAALYCGGWLIGQCPEVARVMRAVGKGQHDSVGHLRVILGWMVLSRITPI